MATNKDKKNNQDQNSAAKAEQPASKAPKTEPATPKATPEATKSTAPAKEESKPVIDAAAAKSATTQSVEPKATTAKPAEKAPEPTMKPAAQTKPTEKLSEPMVKPAAAQVSQPPAPAQPKAPEPVAAKPPQPSFTPPATPAKPVAAPPPASPVTKTVTSSQPSVTQPKVEVYPSGSSTVDFQTIKGKVVTFLENLPQNTVNFFQSNQKPLISLGLILALLITLKITAGLLNILNEIPLVKPLFEAIGVSYSGWFLYRYLLWSSTRKELWQKVDTAKTDILGKTQ
jgi:hypothetical protein